MVDYGGRGPAQPVEVVVAVLEPAPELVAVLVPDPASAGTDDDVVEVVDVGALVGVVEVESVVGVDVAVELEAGGATPVSGETHPAGGDVAPVCPGMSTVPAHPKSEKVASLAVVEPSVKCATDRVCRI
jgi:hypothetical protein